MAQQAPKRTFFDFFEDKTPVLSVKFAVQEEASQQVKIQNQLFKQSNFKELEHLKSICSDVRLQSFLSFYTAYDGFEIGNYKVALGAQNPPLLVQYPAAKLKEFTARYLPGGKLAWTIDLNKSAALYRGADQWLAFAEVGGGPACLTIFLTGGNAGSIYLLCPQPRFNILKPIAKDYQSLLDRIAKDPAAFLKLTRAFVTITGKDRENYGYVPVEYLPNG